jgi:hypothetical protein
MPVIPAKAGIQCFFQHAVDFVFAKQRNVSSWLDSRLRGNDGAG